VLKVVNIRVRSLDLDFLDVSWEVEDTSEDIQDYTFEVLRSEGPAGPWDPITPKFQDTYLYRDANAPQLKKHRLLFYKIRVTQTSSAAVVLYPTTVNGVAKEAELDLEGVEIANRMKLILQEYTGRTVWIFPIRTFGQRCDCFDGNTGRRTRSQCLTCFDTGYVGGFHNPIETRAQIDPYGKVKRQQAIADGEPANTMARLSNFPPLKPRDIIVEAENVRWRVGDVRVTEKLRAPVHQEVTLHMVPTSDIEYRLPLNVNIATLEPSPERQFTNPQKV
jgi:hypothetical protein